MKPIIEIQNISKKFRINSKRQPYLSLRDQLANVFKPSKNKKEDFWALSDISFEILPGESIGIIGKNGAGKSTLLKILSKITPPTSGKIILHGRVASLLEVGTGFHPELSGRENIFLNGSILGMKRKEILKKFDEIVDFSGVEKFLDTPLKHYSSGMQLRLAFAVAAFLEPEILVIDEVLAVGDAEFQKKCISKMSEVSKSGRTILFVSHNMAAVENLCKKTVLLNEGKINSIDQSHNIIKLYLNNLSGNEKNLANQYFPNTNKKAYISQLEFLCNGQHSNLFYMGSDLEIRMHYVSNIQLENPLMGLILYDSLGVPILFFNNKNYGIYFGNKPASNGIISLHIQNLNLMSGFYSLDIYFANSFENHDVKKECFSFQIEYKHFLNIGESLNEKFNRIFYKDVRWEIKPNN